MISQQEMPMYIKDALPALSHELTESKEVNVYDAMNALTHYTSKNIAAHDYNTVKHCFEVAARLYSRGNTIVKNAVQNIFVYSFTQLFHTYSRERKELIQILPLSLYALYIDQVHHRGC